MRTSLERGAEFRDFYRRFMPKIFVNPPSLEAAIATLAMIMKDNGMASFESEPRCGREHRLPDALMSFKNLGSPAHTTAKAGIIGMTRQLAMEGRSHGIRANSISTGVIETNQTREQLKDPEWTLLIGARTHWSVGLMRREEWLVCRLRFG